jgi:hypothetical protein
MAEPQAVAAAAEAPIDQAVVLEAEPDEYEDDSGIDDASLASSTTSIGSSVMKYREENGRTYHAYKVCYCLPFRTLLNSF